MPTTFTTLQTGRNGVLYGADGSTAPTWLGYYLPLAPAGGSGPPTGTAPPTLTLDASWSGYWGTPMKCLNGGCYVFLDGVPAAGLADAVDATLAALNTKQGGRAYRYLLWFGAHRTGKPLVAFGTVPFVAPTGSATAAAVYPDGGLTISSLSLAVPSGLTLQPSTDGATLQLGIAGTARLKLSQTRGSTTTVGSIGGGATIALGGLTTGGLALTAGIDLTIYSPTVNNALVTLCAGVKYFYEVAPAGKPAVVKSQLSPILGIPTGPKTISFDAILDPLRPFDETHTRFTFAAGSPFSSSLLTTTGIPLTLNPVVGSAGFALAADRVTPVGGGPQVDSAYAVLAGSYVIGAGAACPAGPLPLLCGTSGLEAMHVTPTVANGYPGDVLTFHTGQPAFAPGFPPVTASLDDPNASGTTGVRLSGRLTTAYASIAPASGGATAQYYAQPHGAPLFSGGSGLGLLPLLERPLANATASFPLAAYGGAAPEPVPDGFDSGAIAAFEQAVLSPVRREALLATTSGAAEPVLRAGALPSDDDGLKATSPQGFVVTLGGAASWTSLLLAQTTSAASDTTPQEAGTKTLEFLAAGTPPAIDPAVQAAFQTNQLALVVTDPKTPWVAATNPPTAGVDPTFANQIAIEGWPFDVAVGKEQAFGSYSNVMIAKFCHGKLADLVADPKRWTDAATFNDASNDGLVAVSQWVQGYIADGVASPGAEFDHFREIVGSDDWQGVLILKVDVPLKDLPPQVGALRAGLSGSTFYAHHLGIEVSKVDATLAIEGSSSLFGLIDYVDPVYATALASGAPANTPVPPAPGVTYDFKVLRMLVVFENSEVKEFKSTSQVTLNEWFGDPVLNTRLGATGGTVTNSIVIDGSLQRHDGQPVYTFGSAVDTVFDLNSNVLPSVEVLTTSLTTISDSSTGPSTFRFSFNGYLTFAALPGLDAFSFGPPGTATSGGGLAYTDLFLDLVFDPQSAVPRVFTFDPGKIAFDSAVSTPRPGSLYSAFPLTLKGLTAGGKGGTAGLGYLDVALPDVKRSSLGDAWYGLEFDLDLGTPGALAAEVGWTASFILAWAPGSVTTGKTARASVGLHLPGAGGQAKMLSLQGVLKLTIGDLQLRQVPAQGGGADAYMLTLRSIALHFLALQFPPSGSTAFYLFGQPGATPGVRSPLAWYGAYAADSTKALTS